MGDLSTVPEAIMLITSHTDISNTACSRNFAITEILEHILLDLPACDMLTKAQLVSHRWHAIIGASAQIQQALFFKPVPCAPLSFHKSSKFHRARHNPNGFWAPTNNEAELVAPYNHSLIDVMVYQPDSLNKEAILRPEASWRRQLVTQPPIARCVVEAVESDGRTVVRTIHISPGNSEAVRMGQLADEHDFLDKEWCWKDVEG